MRKLSLLFMAMVASLALQSQWTDDPAQNSIIAISDTTHEAIVGEIITITDVVTNDTYVQWGHLADNGFVPTLQRLAHDGTPQWGESGIRFNQFNFRDWSDGVALAITTDHDVVSCVSTADTTTVALRFHPDGTYAWGEQGVTLFGGNGGYRAEIIAGKDGGAWALGCDTRNLYLQYINADGTLNPLITLEPDNDTIQYLYGKLVLRDDNSVFLTYEHIWVQPGSFLSKWGTKEIHLTGFAVDGTQTTSDIVLMQRVDCVVTYWHSAESDGLGGGYTYLSIAGDTTGTDFKVFVQHYDANGNSTISEPYGTEVHSDDPQHNYLDPQVSIEPVTHDLLVTYVQSTTFAYFPKLYVNRITATGEHVWNDALLVIDSQSQWHEIAKPCVSAFEDGSGFAVSYFYNVTDADDGKYTVEAVGYDMNCNVLWNTTLCSNDYAKTFPETISGFHNGQNIIAWSDLKKNIIHGQNFGVDGSMGQGLDVEEIFEDEGEIVNVVRIFNVNGQVMQCNDLNELNTGVYIIQGETESGKIVNKKVVMTKE